MVWLVTVLPQVLFRLFLAVNNLLGLTNTGGDLQQFALYQFAHVFCDKQLLQIEFALAHIVAVQAYKISASNIDTTQCHQPLLIGNVGCIFF